MYYCSLYLNRPIVCKEDCAWYDEKHNQCSIKFLASLYSEKIIAEIKAQSNFAQMQQKIADNDIFDIFFPKIGDKGDNNGG
jgi:hypothetical protein